MWVTPAYEAPQDKLVFKSSFRILSQNSVAQATNAVPPRLKSGKLCIQTLHCQTQRDIQNRLQLTNARKGNSYRVNFVFPCSFHSLPTSFHTSLSTSSHSFPHRTRTSSPDYPPNIPPSFDPPVSPPFPFPSTYVSTLSFLFPTFPRRCSFLILPLPMTFHSRPR